MDEANIAALGAYSEAMRRSAAQASVADPGKVAVCGMVHISEIAHWPCDGVSGVGGICRAVEWSQPNNPLDFNVAPTDADYVADLERLNAEQSEMLRLADGEALWRAAAKAQTDQDLERIANQAEQIGRLICRINQLERENAALKERGDIWLEAAQGFAAKAEGELVKRTMPWNALKHSR